MSGAALFYRKLISLIFSAALLAWANAAQAQGRLSPTVEVIDGCTVLTAQMAFDVSGGAGTGPVDTSTQIQVECTRLALFRIDMDYGSNAAGTQRRMRNASGDFIPYEIYRNAARTLPWGSGWGNAPWGIAWGLGAGSVTAYGRIDTVPGGLSPGVYEDVVTISITF